MICIMSLTTLLLFEMGELWLASWIGLISQPVWWMECKSKKQYGIMVLTIVYAGIYVWGIVKHG